MAMSAFKRAQADAVSLRCSGEDLYRLPMTFIAANGATPAMNEHFVLRLLPLAVSSFPEHRAAAEARQQVG